MGRQVMGIHIYDEFDPEAMAMLQALYSRSAKSVKEHADQVRERGSKKFMESYYVGYGHASIGDCGSTTIFIETVSLLACKAVQDNPLYSGQETSTRYIDFSQQPIVDPVGTSASKAIHDAWMSFYFSSLEPVVAHLKQRFPLEEGQKETVWEKAIQARAFDILRGFLPAGISSQLSWATNLRQAHEHLQRLEHHPLAEIREIADGIRSGLKEKYASSFTHRFDEEVEAYLANSAGMTAYLEPGSRTASDVPFSYTTNIDNDQLEACAMELIAKRPKRAALPRLLSQFGRYRLSFLLDFGSFRDLQRHRNGYCAMPLLTTQFGFHPWYLEQLPEELQAQAQALIEEQSAAIAALDCDKYTRQYYIPLGMTVMCDLDYDLTEMVYVTELRSGKTVHPTLREVAHKMDDALRKEHPALVLHSDRDVGDFDIRRGNQDIVQKPG